LRTLKSLKRRNLGVYCENSNSLREKSKEYNVITLKSLLGNAGV
jgi:hypothetical protein